MLKINHQEENIIVDKLPLFLSWSAEYLQKAFRISLLKDGATIHTVSEIGRDATFFLDSVELSSNADYVIDVVVYGENGETSSMKKTFSTGNFGRFSGVWISGGGKWDDERCFYKEKRNTIVRKKFSVIGSEWDARVNIIGLGFYKLYINGHEITDSELNTDWTNYHKTVYYDTYKLSDFLKMGENEIIIELGNGWFNPAPLKLFGKYNLRDTLAIGEPQVIAEVLLKDDGGTRNISTDSSWECCQGAYLANNIYLGETLDLRLFTGGNTTELINADWKKVVVGDGPQGDLAASFIPKIKRIATSDPAHIRVIDENELIIDFGRITTGFISLSVTALENQRIEITYGEQVNEDYSLNTDSTLAGFVGKEMTSGVIINGGQGAPRRAEQQDRLICHRGLNHFINKFTYHSFRYARLRGINIEQINHINAVTVYTDLKRCGGFFCSDPYLNRLSEAADETKLNNVHSVLSDCARERLAYGGDIVALAESQVYPFDSAAIYEKTIRDFINDIRPNGGIPETAPFMGIKTNGTGGGAGPLGWQLALPYAINIHYRHYGDISVMREALPYLERQLEHLNSLDLEQLGKCCLGDWGSRDVPAGNYKSGSPALHFTTACFYYYHLLLMSGFCSILGLKEKKIFYSSKMEELKHEILSKYKNYDESFADGSQTSYVFALYFGFFEDVNVAFDRLSRLIQSHGYNVRCGIFGQSFLYQICRRYGRSELVFNWLKSESGFKRMLNDGANTLKEFFDDNKNGSCNHAMFSSYAAWLYQGLGGISIMDEAVGSDMVLINPCFIDAIDFVNCWHQTPRGRIECDWRRCENTIELVIKIPYNLKRCTLKIANAYTANGMFISPIKHDGFYKYYDITDMGEVKIVLIKGEC
ncbi:family 78 glycoside hydrolase catalytic domain [Brenneria populi subsp. brevivirga]|uniref:family 78 glycoside hydrolase catalytic domain n=1 Tax=Brenneria populi TaxID=1505588 RepID=UPI002E16CD38|nr:family 78 glycoside hydrolase catalytic domain [Brenneria populi subsp. brevivirga]